MNPSDRDAPRTLNRKDQAAPCSCHFLDPKERASTSSQTVTPRMHGRRYSASQSGVEHALMLDKEEEDDSSKNDLIAVFRVGFLCLSCLLRQRLTYQVFSEMRA